MGWKAQASVSYFQQNNVRWIDHCIMISANDSPNAVMSGRFARTWGSFALMHLVSAPKMRIGLKRGRRGTP